MADRFNASLAFKHQQLLSSVVGRMQAGQPFTPTAQELQDLGDLAGAINYWAEQAGGQPPALPIEGCADDTIKTTIAWGDFKRYVTRETGPNHTGGPFEDSVWCIEFTIPADLTPTSRVGYGSCAEYGGDPWTREMTLSSSPCDFRPADPTGVNGPFEWSIGKQTTIYFAVPNGNGAAVLTPGKTYYFNIRNKDPEMNVPAGFSIIWPAPENS